MEAGSYEMHSEDDKSVIEKNAKRVVKTHAQVQALEKLYNEDKNPSMATKKQLADSIGLSEKQVNGWFCHRRLKDKRGEIRSIGKQDRSSGVIQDHASGHKQDSCGSTKLGEDKNFDTREVESWRLTQQEQIYEQSGNYARNYNHINDASSGSSSSSDDQIDEKNLRYPKIPKFSSDTKSVKARTGPSGYLKVKGQQIENPAITAVKRQLGKHYREDGPPLGVEFDLLPPGSFESAMQNLVEETYCNGEDDQPGSPDVPKTHQHPKFSKGYEYNSDMASHNPNIYGKRFKTAKRSEVPYNCVRLNSSETNPLAYNGSYYPRGSSSVEFPEGTVRDAQGTESRDDYGMWPKQGVISRHRDPPLHVKKVRAERKPYNKYNYSGKTISQGEVENNSYYAMRGYEHRNALDREIPGQIVKDVKAYPERRIIDENRIKVPMKNASIAPKRMKDDFYHQHMKRAPVVDNRPGNFQVMRSAAEVPSSFSEDEETAETDSSMD